MLSSTLYDICCIGHLTADTVITPETTAYLPGGTAWYFSCALQHLPLRYLLVTALAEQDMGTVNALRQKGLEVQVQPSARTLAFENRYGNNPDHRTQRVPVQADPFVVSSLEEVQARIYHLGPLLTGDLSLDMIKALAAKGRVSLDVQGYLRKVADQAVIAADWPEKKAALPYVHTLKANDHELAVLTGQSDIEEGMRLLAGWGVKEIIITLGSMGSAVYAGDALYRIPAYPPTVIRDATGCGDTYMAGYLYQRLKGAGIQHAGEFASAMAGLKLAVSGAFEGTWEEVNNYKAEFSS